MFQNSVTKKQNTKQQSTKHVKWGRYGVIDSVESSCLWISTKEIWNNDSMKNLASENYCIRKSPLNGM